MVKSRKQSAIVLGNSSTMEGRFIFPFSAASLLGIALLLTQPGQLEAQTTPSPMAATVPLAPPVAAIKPVTDEYFGVRVTDPYRNMEDLKDPEVQAWFKRQNDYTRSVIGKIPGRDALLARIKQLDEGAPALVYTVRQMPDGRVFYTKRLASEEVAKLYVRNGWTGKETLLFDPTKFQTPGGPHYSISYMAPSWDGHYIAVGVSQGGSEDAVLRVVDTATGRETGDAIDRTWQGYPSWLKDGRSFVYSRLQKLGPESKPTDRELYSRTYLHVLGRDPDKDPMVFGSGLPQISIEPADLPSINTYPASEYAFGVVSHGVMNEVTLYFAPLSSLITAANTAHIPWKKICDIKDDVTGFDVHGNDLYLLSHKDASRYKIVHTSLLHPDISGADTVLPASEAVVHGFAVAADALYVHEMDGGVGRLVRLPYGSGKSELVPMPFYGSLYINPADQRLPGISMWLSSWTNAWALYAYDPRTRKLSDTRMQPAGPFDHPADVESVEVKVKSFDGTLVPLSIVRKKGIALDGSHPAMLIGYGAYGISIDPAFDPPILAWLEQDGIYAIAHVRGGGEYGEDWHLAGELATKPNTWKDFIACAQYLIDQKYTSSSRLAIQGGSAGGITIGRSITERPDLFAVAIDEVPFSDALRAEFTPNGPPNIPEFGTVKTEDGFKALSEMSAYGHVKDGVAYPAVLVTTGFNDPRVASWQAGKMAARLQAATSSRKPVLLRVDYDAGHGIDSTKSQNEALAADEWSFGLWQFGVPAFQPH